MLKGKNQSTFLPLNRCSLDSPPLDANWNRKSRHTAGLGRKPMERLPTKGRRKGVSKATWKGNIFSAPLAPDKRVSSLDRAGDQKENKPFVPCIVRRIHPSCLETEYIDAQKQKHQGTPRWDSLHFCPNCDYSNMRVHGLFKTTAAVSSPLIEHNSSWMLPAQETYTHLTSLLLSFLEHIHRADWYLPKVMPAWFLKRIKAHSNDCIGSHSGRFKSHQSYPSIWNLFLVLSYISCHRNQKK